MPVEDAGCLAIDPCIRPASASASQAGWKKGGEAELNQQRRVKAGRAGDDGSGERSSKTRSRNSRVAASVPDDPWPLSAARLSRETCDTAGGHLSTNASCRIWLAAIDKQVYRLALATTPQRQTCRHSMLLMSNIDTFLSR